MRVSAADFLWIHDSSFAEAGCVTIVPAADRDRVLAAFGADTASARTADGIGGLAGSALGGTVLVVEVGDALVLLEDNGYQGVRPEVLKPTSRASRAKKAAAFYWGVNGETVLTAGRNGRQQFAVELLGVEDDLDLVPRSLRRLVLEGGSEEGDPLGSGLAAVATYAAVPFGREVLGPGVLYDLEPPASDLEVVRLDDDLYDLPEVQAAVAGLSVVELRQLAAWAATAAVREGSVADEPAVRVVMERLAASQDPAASIDVPPTLERLHADARRAATRFWEYEQELEWGGNDMPDRGYHSAHAPGPMNGRTAISHLEGRFLAQRASVIGALRHLGQPDAVSAALGAVQALVATVRLGRTERGWLFREDEQGRWRDGQVPDPRYDAFLEGLLRLVGSIRDGQDVASVLAAADDILPGPLSEQARAAAIHADALAAAQGRFSTYQVDRGRHWSEAESAPGFVSGSDEHDSDGGWVVFEEP